MNIIYLLIPIALVFIGLAVAAFLWAVKSNQFEDLEGPAHRILFDDDETPPGSPGNKPGEQQGQSSDKND